MLISKTDANYETTVAQGYEEIMNNTLSVLYHDFIYLNQGKTILELYKMRGQDEQEYYAIEEWTTMIKTPTVIAVVIDQESHEGLEFIGKHIYSSKHEAMDYVAEKFKDNALL
ncbi:hypothetical protein [Acinetobacter sp. YH12086]|uniref:hypothetical protein n=1 Tax=Acinetobacter sp. YH12086 TaxID=2601078 RepID=UPI0015D11452|nr:hypothetical protein [Acinetobacter sp. YH12086]